MDKSMNDDPREQPVQRSCCFLTACIACLRLDVSSHVFRWIHEDRPTWCPGVLLLASATAISTAIRTLEAPSLHLLAIKGTILSSQISNSQGSPSTKVGLKTLLSLLKSNL